MSEYKFDDELASDEVMTRFVESAKSFAEESASSRWTDEVDESVDRVDLRTLVSTFEMDMVSTTPTTTDNDYNEVMGQYVYYMIEALENTRLLGTPDTLRNEDDAWMYYDTVVSVCRTLHTALHSVRGPDKIKFMQTYLSDSTVAISLDAAFDKLGAVLMTNRHGDLRTESDVGTQIPEFAYWVVQAMYDVAMLTPGFDELNTVHDVFVDRLREPLAEKSDAWWMETLGFYRAQPMNGERSFGPPGSDRVLGDVADRLFGSRLERIVDTEIKIQAKYEIRLLRVAGDRPSVFLDGILEKRKRDVQVTTKEILGSGKALGDMYSQLVANLIEYIDPVTGERRAEGTELYLGKELYDYSYRSIREEEASTSAVHTKYKAVATELLRYANYWGFAYDGVKRLLNVVSPRSDSVFSWMFSAKDPYPNLRKG